MLLSTSVGVTVMAPTDPAAKLDPSAGEFSVATLGALLAFTNTETLRGAPGMPPRFATTL
jgi:hypothetical protein